MHIASPKAFHCIVHWLCLFGGVKLHPKKKSWNCNRFSKSFNSSSSLESSELYLLGKLVKAPQVLLQRRIQLSLGAVRSSNCLGKLWESWLLPNKHSHCHLPYLLLSFFSMEMLLLHPPNEEELVEEDKGLVEGKMKDYIQAANILADAHLSLRRFITTEKALRSPVTKEELVEEVARQLLVAIQAENLHLPVPLASLGEHEVPLRLPKQIPLPEGLHSWTLHVKIRKK